MGTMELDSDMILRKKVTLRKGIEILVISNIDVHSVHPMLDGYCQIPFNCY